MICKEVKLLNDSEAILKTYILERQEYARKSILRPAVIVCPGGGYALVSQNEGEPVALAYAREGFHTFVLKYSVTYANPFPQALLELGKAYLYVLEHADEFGINKKQIYVAGFSAGGHLALSLGTFYYEKFLLDKLQTTAETLKPAGLILGYPAVSLKPARTSSKPSKELEKLIAAGLCGDFGKYSIQQIMTGKENFSNEEAEALNLLNRIDEKVPPMFIFGSNHDSVIHPLDIVSLAKLLRENNIEFELHLFNRGNHGLSIYDETVAYQWQLENMHMNEWVSLSVKWLKENENECKNN